MNMKKLLIGNHCKNPLKLRMAEATAKSTALPDKLVYSRKDIESLLVNTQNLLEELKFLKDSSSKIQKYWV